MYIGLHVTYPFFVSDFSESSPFSTDFRKILKYKISWNPISGSRVLCDRTDRQTWRS